MALSLFSRCVVFVCVVFPVVFAEPMHVLNGTGGSFPAQLYSQATFFYQFVDPTTTLTYYGPDSSSGKCNAMGYYTTFNGVLLLNNQQVPVPTTWTTPNAYGWTGTSTSLTPTTAKTFLSIEQSLCTDGCTGTGLYGTDATGGTYQCPYDSAATPRNDHASRKPLTDISASDSLPVLYSSQAPAANQKLTLNRDLDFFPDLKLFPAVAGAAVPIFNIPQLQALVTNVTAGYALILGRQTIKKIFSGEITMWNDPLILADNNPKVYPQASLAVQNVLATLNYVINPVVRFDSSGTSEIFTDAVALFDPPCASVGSSSAPGTGMTISSCQNWQDTSFGYQQVGPAVAANALGLTTVTATGSTPFVVGSIVVPGNSKPTWCGRKTDEMFTVTFAGCTGDGSGSGQKVTLAVMAPNGKPDAVQFACDAPAATVQAAFGTTYSFIPGTTPTCSSSICGASANPFGNSAVVSKTVNTVSGTPTDNGKTPWMLFKSCAGNSSYCSTTGAASSVHVSRSGALPSSYTYTVGYWDPNTIGLNWHQPNDIATIGTGLTTTIATFQEGGLTNTYLFGSTITATTQVMSMFLSTSLSTAIVAQWQATSTGPLITTTSIKPTGGVLCACGQISTGACTALVSGACPATAGTSDLKALLTAINTAAGATAVTAITQTYSAQSSGANARAAGSASCTASTINVGTIGCSGWIEYQITFTASSDYTYFANNAYGLNIMDYSSGAAVAFANSAAMGANSVSTSAILPLAFATQFLKYDAAPLKTAPFYASAPSINTNYGTTQSTGAAVTCFMRKNSFKPWTIYSGNGNPGVVAEVVNRPYSIGYSVLGDAILRNLNVAKMINKAGFVVQANQNSVSFAVMDKGGNIDPVYNYAQLGDASSSQAWPISGFTYWLLRTKTHIGSCQRRQAAMSFLYNFYSSPSVTQAAGQLGFATLPGFMATTQLDILKYSAYCNDGQTLALQKYITTPTPLLGSLIFQKILTEFLDAYQVVQPTASLAAKYVDDSRVIWNTFIANPTKYAGAFTMFSATAADKIAQYADPTLITNAFAHIAVVPIYRCSKLTSKLIVTPAIIGGILAGTILTWQDPVILAANPSIPPCSATVTTNCLPTNKINVAVRADPAGTDANAILLRYLNLQGSATPFAAAYATSVAANSLNNIYSFDFASTAIPATQISKQFANDRMDAFVQTFDMSFGYFVLSEISPPASTIPLFCSTSACAGGPINPNNNGATINICQSDPATIVKNGKGVNTYDLQVSSAAGCYPIVGTVDYTITAKADSSTCGLMSPGTTAALKSNISSYSVGSAPFVAATTFRDRFQFSTWVYSGSAVSAPLLTQFSVAPTNQSARHKTLTQMCYTNCAGQKVGYSYCNYVDCSWSHGDYVQVQSACDPNTLKYTITYQLTNPTCIINPAVAPPSSILIDCTSVSIDSYLGKLANALSIIGMVVCGAVGIFAVVYREERILRKSQPVFIYLSVLGAFLMNLSIQAFIGENSDYLCTLRPWVIDLSSTIMFAPLLMKLYRVDVLFRMSKKLKKIKIPDWKVAGQVVLLCLVDVLILIIWTATPSQKPYKNTWPYSGSGNSLLQPITYDACSTTITSPLEDVMIAWKACLLGAGVYMAISTWDHPSDVAEVKHFFLAIYNVSVVGGAMYFFSIYGAQNPGTFMIMRCIGIFVSSTLPCLIIMLPKFTVIQYKQITGKSLWALSGKSSNSDRNSRGSQAGSQIEVVQSDKDIQNPIGSVRFGDKPEIKITVSEINPTLEGKKSEA